jgi:integrase/recombinase XerD
VDIMSSDLDRHLADYLRLRRSLGFKLVREGQVLAQFVARLQAAGATTVSTDLAVAWAQLPQGVNPITWVHRLGAVRGLARYLHTIDPATEIPPGDVFTRPVCRATPYLYSPADVHRLLAAAGGLRPALRAATYQTLFGLLAVTGMRIGESLRLRRDDVDLDGGVLTITGPKSGHTRLVPLHPSAAAALRRYTTCRDGLCPTPRAETFFVSTVGTALIHGCVRSTFIHLTTAIGLRTSTVRPRIHDLRHSFIVDRLLDWYRTGADPAAHMATLSTYVGHVNPAGTYWYLSAVPELMRLAAQRLSEHLDEQAEGRP